MVLQQEVLEGGLFTWPTLHMETLTTRNFRSEGNQIEPHTFPTWNVVFHQFFGHKNGCPLNEAKKRELSPLELHVGRIHLKSSFKKLTTWVPRLFRIKPWNPTCKCCDLRLHAFHHWNGSWTRLWGKAAAIHMGRNTLDTLHDWCRGKMPAEERRGTMNALSLKHSWGSFSWDMVQMLASFCTHKSLTGQEKVRGTADCLRTWG